MKPTLSILICTLPDRKDMLTKLDQHLLSQCPAGDVVEVLGDWRVKVPTGTKRNDLLERARGKYVVFVDDDDWVSADYIPLILEGAKTDPDCFGIQGVITFHRTWEGMLNKAEPHFTRKWFISKDFKWTNNRGRSDGIIYFRYPNHITPMRRSIALTARFPDLYIGEDRIWASEVNGFHKADTPKTAHLFNKRIKASPFKTEYTIDKDIYFYRYVQEKDL